VKNGKAVFNDLPTGLYLIIQEEAAEGFNPLGAFLVSVPYLENGEYRYHVTAAIKSELEREPETEPTTPPPTVPDDPKLPQTGQLNWPIPLMAVAGLGLFIAGSMLCFGKKRERYEK
jgi:LPXTG-motif cell wall-anchored protein